MPAKPSTKVWKLEYKKLDEMERRDEELRLREEKYCETRPFMSKKKLLDEKEKLMNILQRGNKLN